MPLPTFDKQDDIPEAFRNEYVEKEGKWIPKVDDDVAGLKSSQRKLLDERKKAEERAAAFERSFGGRKPEEIEELLAKAQRDEEERQRKAGEFDKLLEKQKAKLLDEFEPKVKMGEAAIRELNDLRFDLAVREVAMKAGIPEKNLKATVLLAKAGVMKLEDGKLTVLDATGDPRSITPEKYFGEEFKADYPELYAASGGSGGGSGGGNDTRRGTGSSGTIDGRDQSAFLANIDKIGKGEVKVTL